MKSTINKSILRNTGALDGFTLVELLVVVAILGILVAALGPSLSSISGSGRTRQGLIEVSGALEKAREYAVSHNTYTWVTWRTLGAPGTPIVQAAFASADGSRADVPVSGSYSGGYGGTNRVILIDRPLKMENWAMKGATALPADSPIRTRVDDFSAGADVSGPGFSGLSSPLMGTVNFDTSVMFTPAGEARVSTALPENIQFVFMPMKGGTIEDSANASLIRISGLTGRVKVYRP